MKKKQICCIIEEGTKETVEVERYEDGTVKNLFITAESLMAALNLILDGEGIPKEEPEKEPEQIEPAPSNQDLIEAYKQSDKGERFLRELEKAKDFTEKHDKASITLDRLWFLTLLANTPGYEAEGVMQAYFYAYRKGYMKGKKK